MRVIQTCEAETEQAERCGGVRRHLADQIKSQTVTMPNQTLVLYSFDLQPGGTTGFGYTDTPINFTAGSFETATLEVTDNDSILHDDGNNVDTDGQQTTTTTALNAFGHSFGPGQAVYSIARMLVDNNTTGQTGYFFVIRFNADEPDEANIAYATTLAITPGDSLTWLASNDTGIMNPPHWDGATDFSSFGLVCFASDTMILTPNGERPVRELTVEDLVVTVDKGAQPIRWIGTRRLPEWVLSRDDRMQPICIEPGALGPGLPTHALRVSPQHRVLVRNAIVQRMSGCKEVLVPAKFLLGCSGIEQVPDPDGIAYTHLLLDTHEIVISAGAPTETLYPGLMALRALGRKAFNEITTLIPDLLSAEGSWPMARTSLTRKQSKELLRRTIKNHKPLICSQRPIYTDLASGFVGRKNEQCFVSSPTY